MQHSDDCSKVYYACAPGYLDMYTLSYRWFGATWTYNEHAQRIVHGYWFGDRIDDIVRDVKQSGYTSMVFAKDMSSIKQIYDSIRSKQQQLDWNNRSRLSIRSMFSAQWRTLQSGFYLVRSREQYPLYLSCIEKKGWFVYLLHSAVCENDSDRLHFMNKVNIEHQIQLEEVPSLIQ